MFGLDVVFLLKSIIIATVLVACVWWFSNKVGAEPEGSPTVLLFHKVGMIVLSVFLWTLVTFACYSMQVIQKGSELYWESCEALGGSKVSHNNQYVCVSLDAYNKAQQELKKTFIDIEE